MTSVSNCVRNMCECVNAANQKGDGGWKRLKSSSTKESMTKFIPSPPYFFTPDPLKDILGAPVSKSRPRGRLRIVVEVSGPTLNHSLLLRS